MQKITSNDQLIPGEWYWCISKNFTNRMNIYEVVQLEDDTKYLAERVWATDHNSQALEKWDIYGPIPKPYLEVQIIDVEPNKSFWVDKKEVGNKDLYYRYTRPTLNDGYLVAAEYLFEKFHKYINFSNPSQIVYTKEL